MALELAPELVWQALGKELFAVIGMVNAQGQARTVGVVYLVRDGKLYLTTGSQTWKARHIRRNPAVSVTVPIPKRVPFMPWIKVPAATITFSGRASVLDPSQVDGGLLHDLLRGGELDPPTLSALCVIAIEPVGECLTYGVGVPLMAMRTPEKARGRAVLGPAAG